MRARPRRCGRCARPPRARTWRSAPSVVPRPGGFGRRALDVLPTSLRADVAEQVETFAGIAVAEGAEVTYLKPHGALYTRAIADGEVAAAIVGGLGLHSRCSPGRAPSSSSRRSRPGLEAFAEGFADRGYANGRLVPRDQPGALLRHAGPRQAVALARAGEVRSICVHGDTPGAAALAAEVRAALVEAGRSRPAVRMSVVVRPAGDRGTRSTFRTTKRPVPARAATVCYEQTLASIDVVLGHAPFSSRGRATPAHDPPIGCPREPPRRQPTERPRRSGRETRGADRSFAGRGDRSPHRRRARRRVPRVPARVRLSRWWRRAPSRSAARRAADPRPRRTVAIAGPYSGVYPRDSPGGWRLLGSTTAVMFDPTREPPALLAPGDRVRFVAV